MRIVGIGMDACEIPRIEGTIERYGERFLRRILTDHEYAYCTRKRFPAPSVAGRFAAKEAGMKAIGTGQSQGVLWRDIEVVRHGGAPQLVFHGAARGHFERLGATKAFVTITHAETLALAHVILVAD
jgi:holo-[acyl-carrier protein] synthase